MSRAPIINLIIWTNLTCLYGIINAYTVPSVYKYNFKKYKMMSRDIYPVNEVSTRKRTCTIEKL